MAEYNLYNRRWQLLVNNGEQELTWEGFKPGASKGLSLDFKITKTSDTTPNDAEINIINLSPEHQDFVTEKGLGLTFLAGYRESFGQIFKGGTEMPNHERSGGDWVTTLYAKDGGTALKQAFISKSFKKDAPIETVINALIKELTLPPKMEARLKELNQIAKGTIKTELVTRAAQRLLEPRKHKQSKPESLEEAKQRIYKQKAEAEARAEQVKLLKDMVLKGKVWRALDLIAGDYGLSFYVTDQIAYLTAADVPISDQVILVSPVSGLLGSPGRTEMGWKFRSLLRHEFNPGMPVYLDSQKTAGLFVIRKVEHLGNTNSNEWYSDCEVTPLAA